MAAKDPFYIEAMTHDRSDTRELEGTLDRGYDLIYHDIKEAMHAEQRHHGYEQHSYDLQPHVEDYPFRSGQHGKYEGSYMPGAHHFVPATNGESFADAIVDGDAYHRVFRDVSPDHSHTKFYKEPESFYAGDKVL